MRQEVTEQAKILYFLLNAQGEEAKRNAIEMTLSDFENSTAQEMKRDFDNNDLSDMDDLSNNYNIYKELKNQILNVNSFNKEDFKESENKILSVYEYYEKKFIREIKYRDDSQNKNYIETILTPIILISMYINDIYNRK